MLFLQLVLVLATQFVAYSTPHPVSCASMAFVPVVVGGGDDGECRVPRCCGENDPNPRPRRDPSSIISSSKDYKGKRRLVRECKLMSTHG